MVLAGFKGFCGFASFTYGCRGPRRSSEVLGGPRRSSEVASEVLGGPRRSSEVLGGPWSPRRVLDLKFNQNLIKSIQN